MAGLAEVIPLHKPRSCWECQWHRDIADPIGVSSYCAMFAEPIHWEGQADECDAFEVSDASTG